MLEKLAWTPIAKVHQRKPICVRQDAPLGGVVDAMREHHRSAVVVVDAEGHLVGLFTERDALARLSHADASWPAWPVAEVMTRSPTTVGAQDSIRMALQRMRENDHRHLPVVDADFRPVMIVAMRDVLAYVAEWYPQEFVNLPPTPAQEAREQWGG